MSNIGSSQNMSGQQGVARPNVNQRGNMQGAQPNVNQQVNVQVNQNQGNANEEINVLQAIDQRFTEIDNSLGQIPNTVINLVKQLGSYEVSAGDRNIDASKEKFLQYKNILRSIRGLKLVPYIYCKVCKEINMHLTMNCPRLVCAICLMNGHKARNCPRKVVCQICGNVDHPYTAYKDERAIDVRAAMSKICILCKCRGHIARDCGTKGSGINVNAFNWRFKNRNWNAKRWNFKFAGRKNRNTQIGRRWKK